MLIKFPHRFNGLKPGLADGCLLRGDRETANWYCAGLMVADTSTQIPGPIQNNGVKIRVDVVELYIKKPDKSSCNCSP